MTMVETEVVPSDGTNATSMEGHNASTVKETRHPFPVKVYEMLEDADPQGFAHIVSWNHQGTGFMVHKKDLFIRQIVPQYFNQTKYKSFQRQLSLYGFQRITMGPNKGLRHHWKLRRGCHDLVCQMKPVGYKPRGPAKMLEHQEKMLLTAPDAVSVDGVVQYQYHSSSSPMTVHGNSSSTSNGGSACTTVLIPTVVSSGSLDKEQTVVQVLSQIQTQMPSQQLQQAQLTSPGAVSEEEESSSEGSYCINDEDLNDILEQGLFEGMSFFLMTSTQDALQDISSLSVGVATAAPSSAIALPPPAVMDVQLKKAYETGYKMALAMNKKNAATTSNTEPQQEHAAPDLMLPSPQLRFEDCVDALDFHAANIAATTGTNL